MEVSPLKSNRFVKFFDQETLKKERELIDSWDYEICNQYGMDCLFISQKAKFPKTRQTPLQNDLFFHAYGEISRPEYNEPFQTRVYVQFTEDLFAINGFGLNTDLNTTLIFNKTSFALDGALAMADNKTINKQLKIKAEVDSSEKYAIINYKSDKLKFKARFNWQDNVPSVGDERLIEGELYEFSIDPDNQVKPDVLNTFKRRYSASSYIEKAALYFKCRNDGTNKLNGKTRLSGLCICNFVVKNPWKAYSENLNRITPSVGDIVLLNGIDNKIIKLELTEVEAENKTAQGISPLLGSYSFKCIAKPYIADNNASVLHDPTTAPTDINAKKLVIQTVMNHDASKIADNISVYDKLYTDDMGMDFTEDDIYGGYDLEPPNGLDNPPKVPIKHDDIVKTNERNYKWDAYKDKNIQITIDSETTITYSPDEVYTYLRNIFDTNYTDYLVQKWKPTDVTSVDYTMFDRRLKENGWQKCKALNVELWFNEYIDIKSPPIPIKYKGNETGSYSYTISAYTETDRRIRQILENNELLDEFIRKNQELFAYTNTAAYDGISNKYGIPLMQTAITSTYKDILEDKDDAYPIVISYENVYEISSIKVTEISSDGKQYYKYIDRYVKNPKRNYNLKTDLYDIEQYNLGSSDFEKVVTETTPSYRQWKQIVSKKVNGPLITVYQFENTDNSRLATNGEKLFYETRHDEQIYRTEISSFENEIELGNPVKEYSGKVIPLSRGLNWIEADDNGIYFNSAYGKRTVLYGKKDIEYYSMSHLNYENDISSPQNSFILTFKNSKYYLIIQPTDGPFILKLGQ